jgi:glutathione peroxidase
MLLLPCDAFPSAQQRWRPNRHPPLDDAAQLAFAAQHGLLPPVVRLLAKGDVNGPRAHAVWTWMKVSFRDTSDIGGNFGKWLIRSDGSVYGRYTPLLRPHMLQPAISLLVEEREVEAAPAQHSAGDSASSAAARAAVPRTVSSPDTGQWGTGLSGEL